MTHQTKWIIRRHDPVSNRWNFLWFKDGRVVWHDNTPTSCTRFDNEDVAIAMLELGQRHTWSGVFVIEKIYVL